MYSQSDIEDAVAGGALAPEQAARLRDHVAARNGTPTGDEEYVRVFRGYNDAFIFYACLTALVALGWLGTMIEVGGGGSSGMPGIPVLPVFAPLFVAVGSWGLAEIFTLRRHTALPSILLAITFILATFLTLIMLLIPLFGRNIGATGGGVLTAACALVGGGAGYFFWRRFRVAITPALIVAMGVLGLIALLAGLLARSGPGSILQVALLIAGIGTFVYAMRWDGKDLARRGPGSDVAFWLHCLAAALIVYPLLSLLNLGQGVGSVGGAILMLAIFLLLALVALVINRKVWIMMGLSPLGVAITSLIHGARANRYDDNDGYGEDFGGGYGANAGDFDGPSSSSFPTSDLLTGTFTTLLIISLILLLLAIFWSPIRRIAVGLLPAGLRSRLPATGVDAPATAAAPVE